MILACFAACAAGATPNAVDDSSDDSSGAGASGTGASSGTGGASGSGTSGASGVVMNPPSSYPQNAAGGAFPFPQGHLFSGCAYPAYDTDKVQAAYTNWKAAFFQNGRIIRPENSNDTVSEGIAYGMLIGVYMNDRSMFDSLWSFAQTKLNGSGLMTWHLDVNGNPIGSGSATDADEDMAFALLMADKQWGGYQSAALNVLNNIFAHEVDPGGVLKPGDNFGGSNQTNPSYFAPAYYRVFARVQPSHQWNTLVETSYQVLAADTGSYGLVPNWSTSAGVGVATNDGSGIYYGYDACRTPWRIALDYCMNGEPRAKTYLDKVVGFFATQSVIMDGYTTTGQNPPGTLGDYAAGMAFYGPVGVAASATQNTALMNTEWTTLVGYTTTDYRNGPGIFTYYHASWGVLSLMTLSGNFWDMTQ